MLSRGGGGGGGGWWGLDSIDADCARSPVDPAVPCRIAPDQAVDTNLEATLRLGWPLGARRFGPWSTLKTQVYSGTLPGVTVRASSKIISAN